MGARLFTKEFYEQLSEQSRLRFGSEGEKIYHLRKLCISGYMALDSALSLYFKEVVMPDWDGLMSMVDEILLEDSYTEQICKALGGTLTKGQLIASLRFLENTGDPERFSPSLVDLGVVMFLMKDANSRLPHLEIAQMLCRMQKLRNCVFHTGKIFGELEAASSVKLLRDFLTHSQKLNPVFRDCFSDEVIENLRAA